MFTVAGGQTASITMRETTLRGAPLRAMINPAAIACLTPPGMAGMVTVGVANDGVAYSHSRLTFSYEQMKIMCVNRDLSRVCLNTGAY